MYKHNIIQNMRRYSKSSSYTWVITNIIHFKILCGIKTNQGNSATKIPALPLIEDLITITTMGFWFSTVNSHLNHYPVPILGRCTSLLLFSPLFIPLAHNMREILLLLLCYLWSDDTECAISSTLLDWIWPHACSSCKMNCLFHIYSQQKRTLISQVPAFLSVWH